MLPTILSIYKLNGDKFGVLYWLQANKSLHLQNEKCVGGEHSKLHLTGLTSANAIGEKLQLFVIGKFKSPRCFKNVNLPRHYRSQKKSWMDGTLFEEWVYEIDLQFMKEGQNIVLLIDYCPAQPTIDNLISIELILKSIIEHCLFKT